MKILHCATLTFLLATNLAFASKTYVSIDFGFDPANSTAYLDAAINSAYDTVVVDSTGQTWFTNPLFITRNNLVLIFENGVTLEALPGYGTLSRLITISSRSNISLIGYGAILKMRKADYVASNDSQFRHCLHIVGSTNISVAGLEIRDSGGDGILIGSNSTTSYSSYISVYDCLIDNNYRQGISIISAQNVSISHCHIRNTIGHAPEAGIDIEPFLTTQTIRDICISDTHFENNNGYGLKLALTYFNDTLVSVDVNRCRMSNNQKGGFDLNDDYYFDTIPCDGYVKLNNCLIENNPKIGVHVVKLADKLPLTLENIIIKYCGTNPIAYSNAPVFFEPVIYGDPGIYHGGVYFNHVLVEDTLDRSWVSRYGGVLSELSGDITIINPAGGYTNYNGSTSNITLTDTFFTGYPAIEISISSPDSCALEGMDLAAFAISRSASNIAYPIAAYLDWAGTATMRDDYPYHPEFAIISSGETSASDTIYVRSDDVAEIAETIDLQIETAPAYSIGTASAQLFILSENATNTWTGVGGGVNWSDATNWSDGFAPVACQNVALTGGSSVTVAAGVNAVGLTLDVPMGAELEVAATGTLEVGQ